MISTNKLEKLDKTTSLDFAIVIIDRVNDKAYIKVNGKWKEAQIVYQVGKPQDDEKTALQIAQDALISAIENKKQKQQLCVFKSDGTLGSCGVSTEEWERVCSNYAQAKTNYEAAKAN